MLFDLLTIHQDTHQQLVSLVDWIPSLSAFVALSVAIQGEFIRASANASVWLCRSNGSSQLLVQLNPSLFYRDATRQQGAASSYIAGNTINYLLNNYSTYVLASVDLSSPYRATYTTLNLSATVNNLIAFAMY